MEPKQQNGGRELNKISASAILRFKSIFFRQAKFESQEVPHELVEVRESNLPNRAAGIFSQTLNLSNL